MRLIPEISLRNSLMTDRQSIYQHRFENGLVLVAQSMPWLQSVAFSCAVPAGCSRDPHDKRGLSNFCCEMVFRGGGDLDNRRLVEELEGLGCDYFSSTSVYHSFFGGAMPAEGLDKALALYADVIRRPLLPPDQLEDGRLACLQEIQSLEDDLASKVMLELRRRHYQDPYGRSREGIAEHVAAMTLDDVRQFYDDHYQPQDAVIAVAGKIDWPQLRDVIGQKFGDWKPRPDIPLTLGDAEPGVCHIAYDSNQTHIAIAWPVLPYSHPDYYQARGAVGVLSDGMSSRLFREVRERRGLCYTVSASCHSLRDRGSVICYCGTTTHNAQQSLDVLIEQFEHLTEGITQEELDRLKVQIRSGLIMQQESCRSRAATLAGDIFHLGHVRTLDEVNAQIGELTVESINRFLKNNPPGPYDIVTLGERPLEWNHGIPATATK
jgi:predicted Zn-dependent peptidase